MAEVSEEELEEQLDDIDNFIETFHRFSMPFIATFNIAILIAMVFDHEVRVKVYRRYLLAVQVILIVTSVFLGRIQIVAICDDFAFYMLGDLFGLSALELIITYAFLVLEGQVAVGACLFFRHQQLASKTGRLHFASRKMHLMILAYNIFFLLGLPILYFGLKPMVISTEELSSRQLDLYGEHETLAIFKKDLDTLTPILGMKTTLNFENTSFALFQVPYLIIIFSLCLHIFYNLLFKDHKMTKLHRRYQLRSFITVSLQLSFSFLTLALPFMVGCLGIFRSVATNKPVQSYFRKMVAYCITCMSSHSFFNSLVLIFAIPSLRKTLYFPIDFIINRGKMDNRTAVLELTAAK